MTDAMRGRYARNPRGTRPRRAPPPLSGGGVDGALRAGLKRLAQRLELGRARERRGKRRPPALRVPWFEWSGPKEGGLRPNPRRFAARFPDVFGVAAAVLVDAVGADFDDAVGQGAEEVPVVGDEEQGAVVVGERLDEHLLGFDVEVIGGL